MGILAVMPVYVYMYVHFLCACTVVFPTEKVEQMIMTSLDDVTMINHAIWGGKYISRGYSSFGVVIWVSGTEHLGLLLNHQPSTPTILVPVVEMEYIQDELFSLFIHVHAPRLFGNILVSMTLVVWLLAG